MYLAIVELRRFRSGFIKDGLGPNMTLQPNVLNSKTSSLGFNRSFSVATAPTSFVLRRDAKRKAMVSLISRLLHSLSSSSSTFNFDILYSILFDLAGSEKRCESCSSSCEEEARESHLFNFNSISNNNEEN